ncbi:MAG TPA: hypothetical protein VFZ08_05910 [Terriglobia bacterium]|nr:hypothetical protein [Terriglobia bacterium]
MADQCWRSTVLEIKGIPEDSDPFLNVPLKGLTGQSQSDVDILLSPPCRPDLTTVIEVKKIKVSSAALRNQTPNKLQGLKKGKKQANARAEIGFWQVYLYVLVVVDSREQNAGRFTYDGLSPELRSFIGQAITLEDLNERVGLFHCEFVQPMDKKPLSVGTYHGHLIRLARPVEQSREVTEWVKHVTADASHG